MGYGELILSKVNLLLKNRQWQLLNLEETVWGVDKKWKDKTLGYRSLIQLFSFGLVKSMWMQLKSIQFVQYWCIIINCRQTMLGIQTWKIWGIWVKLENLVGRQIFLYRYEQNIPHTRYILWFSRKSTQSTTITTKYKVWTKMKLTFPWSRTNWKGSSSQQKRLRPKGKRNIHSLKIVPVTRVILNTN